MKNNTQAVNHHSQIKAPNWLYQELGEDDFLVGKTPMDLGETWEEEE